MNSQLREFDPQHAQKLEASGVQALLSRILAARGVQTPQELDLDLKALLPPSAMLGCEMAGQMLAQAILQDEPICIVADYDCDGATACATALLGLEYLGAKTLHYIVPDRIKEGYGLTPHLAQRAHQLGAHWLLTVDNGIASIEGVEHAKKLGLRVIITDHHLPAHELPKADVVVNPNQALCPFPSKNLSGVGVMFYVLLSTRAHLRALAAFDTNRPEPKLDGLLPLVALGTVADLVTLDANNRRLVHHGLERIRRGQLSAGLNALIEVCGKDRMNLSSSDLGFFIAPRINAAGRLSDMTLGIECLKSGDAKQAHVWALALHEINQSRKNIESEMTEQALDLAQNLIHDGQSLPHSLCLFDPQFHEGVVGIVASRMKEKHHRPTFVFAPSLAQGKSHVLKGSGRSIAGFHLRDALDAMSKKYPSVLLQFGGHAMAAGCSIETKQLNLFEHALEEVAQTLLSQEQLTRITLNDGALTAQELNLQTAQALQAHVWGQGFATPVFINEFVVLEQRIVGEKHLALTLDFHGQRLKGIWFGQSEPIGHQSTLVYQLMCEHWRGQEQLKLHILGQG